MLVLSNTSIAVMFLDIYDSYDYVPSLLSIA